ncbi:TetR/AcrR family transcriptional regulator [Yinghuangia sp. ASG 101]|uniref:TetR/AcrR family transcriptional regulator n=1 Tax=Yinghuangia sp. ASG 101 TaxID=2896848 RepID=UPI001E3D9191|nr:TetR/AcrR family transcriptional regulator [Yinghuangia sp. ASG 101]UGQ12755.1 TetR/AcrR family transcriptional regulator [Yinghuangia sp. ASG 101]
MSGTPSAKAGESNARAALLDATARLMAEEGYAAVSTRKVAAKAGVNHALVYYYFRTMDELFLAVFRRGAEANLRRLERARASDHPLQAMWAVVTDPKGAALTQEFIALANHRDSVRTELAMYAQRFRRMQVEMIEDFVKVRGVDTGGLSPTALTILMGGLPRILAMDDVLGLTEGHDEVLALVELYLRRFDGPLTADGPAADGTASDDETAPDAAASA